MTDSTFEYLFTFLEDYHGRKQTERAKKHYREEFQDVPDEVFHEAIKAAARKYAPGRFPSPGELHGFVYDAAERLARRRPKTAAETPPDPEVGKAVLQRLGDELDQRDREKEHRVVEQRDRDRQDRTQRINTRKQLLNEQARSLDGKVLH